MILYLLSDYHMSVALGANVLLIWSAATNFLRIVGGFLVDPLLGRFLAIFLGSIFSLMYNVNVFVGMILLWLTTMLPNAKPPPCDLRVLKSCQSPMLVKYTLLFTAFALMSTGAGSTSKAKIKGSNLDGFDQIELSLSKEAHKHSQAFLSDDPSLPPSNQGNYLPEVRKELKICEAKSDKSSVDEPQEVELKDLPPHLEYAFLEGDNKLSVIIAKDLSVEEKTALITVLKSHKRAIAWKLSNIKGIDPEFCTHKILMEEDFEPAVQHQR
uniref:Protein NRT1/ PTR FAMILY 1.2-like n=1 Tax=Tanacetum cinerariifolium TaxID=118510 RepID=A0A699H1E7_TANCI|nr:protein NRT1/ PTR FAMILY 1.2-like [Tanacetum cinerariifolium]